MPTEYLKIAATPWTCADIIATEPNTIDRAVRWDSARSLRSIAESLALLTAPLRGAGDAINLVKDEVVAELAAQRKAQAEALASVTDRLDALVDDVRERLKPERQSARVRRELHEQALEAFRARWVVYEEAHRLHRKACNDHRGKAWAAGLPMVETPYYGKELETYRMLTQLTREVLPIGMVLTRPWQKGRLLKLRVEDYGDKPGSTICTNMNSHGTHYLKPALDGVLPLFDETPPEVTNTLLY